MIELYHCAGGRSLRCLWMMEEIGLPYRLRVLPFPPRLLAPEFLTLNPLGTIPLFIDGRTRMTESAAILDYLSTRYAMPPLHVPPDDPAYGDWLNWIHFGEATLTTPQTVVLRYGLFEPAERRQPVVQRDYTQVFLDKLAVVTARLEHGDYMCADRFTAADISVGYALTLAPYIGAEDNLPPIVRAYLQRLLQRPAYGRCLVAQADPANAVADAARAGE